MPSPAERMIEDLYEEEQNAALQTYHESKLQAFSIRIDARTAAIIEGIAKRFGKSRNAIVSELLWSDAETMWGNLKQEDRFLVAEHGDSLLQKLNADISTLLTPKERKMKKEKASKSEDQKELKL